MKREERKTTPHFWNLNEDPQLTSMVIHLIKEGRNRVGNQKATHPPEILINGLSVQQEHAVLENEDNSEITLIPGNAAKILVNGEPIDSQVILHHNDR